MTLSSFIPDWLPWWAALAILVPVLLYALAFLAMPFSVLGLKGRLESIEARLDEIQGEVRALSLRLPERGMFLAEAPAPRPPIPPAAYDPARAPEPRYVEPRYAEPRHAETRATELRRAAPPAAAPARAHDDDPAPPDPSTAPPRRPLRAEPRLDPPTRIPPRFR